MKGPPPGRSDKHRPANRLFRKLGRFWSQLCSGTTSSSTRQRTLLRIRWDSRDLRAGCYHFATTCLVEQVRDGRVPHREPSAVQVHGELDRVVTELALDVDWSDPLLEQDRCVAMAEAVGREVRGEPGGLEGALEVPL